MENLLTAAGALLFLFAGLALPLVVLLSGVYLMVKRRQWTHIERMKMIECGLIREETDFERASGSLKVYEHSIFFEMATYALLLALGFLFALFTALAIFCFRILDLPVSGYPAMVWVPAGILGTFVLTLCVRRVPSFYRYRKLFLFSCLALTLTWGICFLRETAKIPVQNVKQILLNPSSAKH